MSHKAQSLVGQNITLSGHPATVTDWAEHHPLSQGSGEQFGPISMESDPDGWLKVCMVAGSDGQWWRYDVLSRNIDKKPATAKAATGE